MTKEEIIDLLLSYPREVKCVYQDGREFTAKFAGFADGRRTLVFMASPNAPAETWVELLASVEVVVQ